MRESAISTLDTDRYETLGSDMDYGHGLWLGRDVGDRTKR